MNNKDIGNNAIEFAIERYLREGETRHALIKQFDGDNIKLVQWLREREFAEFAQTEPVAVPSVVKEEKVAETQKEEVIEPIIDEAEEKVEAVAEPLPEPINKPKVNERVEQIKRKHEQEGDSQLSMF